MSHEIQQWIAEIKSLQQQLAEMERDREAAHESAANWRQLYNTEAQQRRDDAKLAQQAMDALKAEIERLRESLAGKPDGETDVATISTDVEQLQTVEELKAKLIEILIDRDRLARALKAEQDAHAETREKLTTALGDAVDVLAIVKGKSTLPREVETEEETPPPAPAQLPGKVRTLPGLPDASRPVADLPALVKTPSLKLPPTRPAPPRF